MTEFIAISHVAIYRDQSELLTGLEKAGESPIPARLAVPQPGA